MDLPTYTNIWRIEKRLYKLYDFRLPMPLPVGQITVFAAIALPYVLVLTLIGVPFSHSLVWLYLLPPGLVTWLVTRPVLEGKRLPELIRSQLGYLAEPRVWCRMAPLAEDDLIVVTGRVWRLSPDARELVGETAKRRSSSTERLRRLARVRPADARPADAGPAGARPVAAAAGSAAAGSAAAASAAAASGPAARRRVRQREVPQWQTHQRQGPQRHGPQPAEDQAQVQPVQVQVRSGAPEQVRAGAASARAARAAAVRARAAGSAPVPPAIPGLGHPVASARPELAPPARPAASRSPNPIPPPPRPATPLTHPPVRPVPPDEPVVLRDEPVVLRDRPSRAPTAPPTRSAAAWARPAEAEPANAPEPLSIPRQAASPDVADLPAAAAAPAALAPAPHGQASKPSAADAFMLSEAADREPVQLDPARPHITVVNSGAPADPAPTVERMLAGPSVRRGDGISGRVMVVPGGHRPGKPDQLQRDRARAQLPIPGHRRVIVLGCTVGAGQTVTALLTGEVLAGLRSEPIAGLDLNSGANSLVHRGRLRPALGPVSSVDSPRLAIFGPDATEDETDPADPAAGPGQAMHLFEDASAGHPIVLADPSTTVVPRLLSMADQLILVAPASAAAARAISMTFEWLDAHGHADLASEAIMVMNGVSRRSTAHVEQAERGCIGRCRAIVRVPWDDQLGVQAAKRAPAAGSGQLDSQWAGVVSPATAGAYTALAGVLVVALADQAGLDDDPGGSGRVPGSSRAGSGWGPR